MEEDAPVSLVTHVNNILHSVFTNVEVFINNITTVMNCMRTSLLLDISALQQIINRIPLLNFRHLGPFPSDYVPALDNDTFAIINTQSSNMQKEHWIMIANFRYELCFADSLGCKRYSFLNNNQHYKQMMPATLQSHPGVWGFYTIYAAFHLLMFRLEEITGVHAVIVLSCINFYM